MHISRPVGFVVFLIGLVLLLLCFFWCYQVFASADASVHQWLGKAAQGTGETKGIADFLPLAAFYVAGLRLVAALAGAFIAGRVALIGLEAWVRAPQPVGGTKD